jgi:hypothetical protein
VGFGGRYGGLWKRRKGFVVMAAEISSAIDGVFLLLRFLRIY